MEGRVMGKGRKRERGHRYSQREKSKAKPGQGFFLNFFGFFTVKTIYKHKFFRWNKNNTDLVDNAQVPS